MNINILEQIFDVLYSILFGVFLGVIYDIISGVGFVLGLKELDIKVKKKIKLNLKNKKIHFKRAMLSILDVIYFIIIAPFTSIFIFGINSGIIRWYIIAGILIGFVIYKASLGKLTNIALSYISLLMMIISNKIKGFLIAVIKKAKIKKKIKQKKKNIDKKNLLFVGIKG